MGTPVPFRTKSTIHRYWYHTGRRVNQLRIIGDFRELSLLSSGDVSYRKKAIFKDWQEEGQHQGQEEKQQQEMSLC
jgi:hypothetical protein